MCIIINVSATSKYTYDIKNYVRECYFIYYVRRSGNERSKYILFSSIANLSCIPSSIKRSRFWSIIFSVRYNDLCTFVRARTRAGKFAFNRSSSLVAVSRRCSNARRYRDAYRKRNVYTKTAKQLFRYKAKTIRRGCEETSVLANTATPFVGNTREPSISLWRIIDVSLY